MSPGVRLFLFAPLICAAGGLRVIDSPDFNCSQPGIRCSVLNSNCLDLSWIHPFEWTPTAPSKMAVTAGIGVNEQGHNVSVLEINWIVSIDSSILDLQGAEISVLDVGSNLIRCVQFQFGDRFPGQQDHKKQAWKFFYNKFEVIPGNKYHISVQHLPKQGTENLREQEFSAPGCSDSDMMQTDTCCGLGHCWSPNITVDFDGDILVVTFTPRSDAREYGVRVVNSLMKKTLWCKTVPQVAMTERVQVTCLNPVRYKPCWYNVSVWPYMPSCDADCVRQWYAPTCPPPSVVVTTSAPSGPGYVWPFAAAVTITAFTITIILLWSYRACTSPKDTKSLPQQPTVPPGLVKRKVWLVYSADHKLYVKVVIRLADFLRMAWGLDVVLDRLENQEIGRKGAMPWLSYQKDQIEKANGTILILCSRGAQAKWKAMKNGQKVRVELPEDINYEFKDLFTPALTLILPDFQKAKPYDRYVVAYFSELSDVGDIPSPLEICQPYALTKNLQMLLFRIQRIERHQPNIQYDVDCEGNSSYQHLVAAVEKCRAWQETHLDWLGKAYFPAEAMEDFLEEEEAGHELTRRVYPRILQADTSVSMLSPCIMEPDPVRSVNPCLVDAPSSVCVVPLLNEEPPPVAVLQPSLNSEASRASYRQQPYLVDVDESFPLCNERLHQMDPSAPSDQDVQSEDLSELQIRLFFQNVLEDQQGASNMDFNGESLDCLVDGDESVYDIRMDLPAPRDQDVWMNDLMEVQKRLVLQTIFDSQQFAPDMVFDAESQLHEHQPLLVNADIPLPPVSEHLPHADASRHSGDLEIYEELNVLMGRTDHMPCHSEDLGYGTLYPNNLEEVKGE